jgi:hypothetical protein
VVVLWDLSIVFTVRDNSNVAAQGIFTDGILDTEWHHLVGVYNGVDVRVYVDTVIGGTIEAMTAVTGTTGASLNIAEADWNGLIDDVRIYNRALSQADITTLYNYTGGTPPPDTTPPVRSNGAPTGTLSAGTTSTTLSLTTNENATCRYGTVAGTSYALLPNTFTTTGSISHTRSLSGLTNGTFYTYYVRCIDTATNANSSDYTISFSVANPSVPDTIPPTVSITSPTNGSTVSGTITVSANASDNIGIAGVQFLLNGSNLGSEDTSSPYAVSWNTTSASNGSYTISARARDMAGNMTTSLNVTVMVSYTLPPHRRELFMLMANLPSIVQVIIRLLIVPA